MREDCCRKWALPLLHKRDIDEIVPISASDTSGPNVNNNSVDHEFQQKSGTSEHESVAATSTSKHA